MDDAVTGDFPKPSAGAGGVSLRLSAAEWGLLLVLASMQFTHIVDFMIIMPLGPEYMKAMSLTPEQFGRMVSAYTISAGIASLFAARFLDRFDRKTALLCLYGGFTVGTLLCAAAPTYTLLLAARTVAGAFGGVTAATVLAIVGDAFPHARRGTAMGVLMYGFSLATVAGLPMGLILAEHFGWQAPFIGLGILSAGMLILAAALLPSFRGHLSEPVREDESLRGVALDPNHVRAFLLMLALVASSFLIAPFIATYLEFNVKLPKEQLKYVYLCGGLATLLTLTLFGKLSDRFGKLRVFRVVGLACAVPFLWIPNLPEGASMVVIILATMSMFVFTSGRMVPAMALITNSAAPRVRGSFMSLNSAVQQFGAGIATWIAGIILNRVEGEDGPLTGYSKVGLLAAIAVVASVYLAGRLRPAPGGALAPDAEAVDPHHFVEESPSGIIADHERVMTG
jgi:MFS transporter, DHA1 family, inner membrane transport protein